MDSSLSIDSDFCSSSSKHLHVLAVQVWSCSFGIEAEGLPPADGRASSSDIVSSWRVDGFDGRNSNKRSNGAGHDKLLNRFTPGPSILVQRSQIRVDGQL